MELYRSCSLVSGLTCKSQVSDRTFQTYLYFFKNNAFHIYTVLFICLFGAALGLRYCVGFSLATASGAPLPCGTRASHRGDFSCCEAQALGSWASVVTAPGLQSTGSVVVAPGLSCSAASRVPRTRDQTRVPCTGRRILYHSATRGALVYTFMISFGPSNVHTGLPHQDLCSFRTQASYLLFQSEWHMVGYLKNDP